MSGDGIQTKKWYKSKTVWFNGLVSAVTLLSSNSEVLAALIPGAGVYIPAVVAVANILLRTTTKAPLGK